MSIVQNPSVADTSNLQTELERTKERFENCIIKKENEYAKLWNDWYKKCKECKYDKISYDKAYNDMQQKIERLQAQLGDLKYKNKDTPCVSDTLDPLSQKLDNENVELEFQNDLSNPVTSNSVSTTCESKVVTNDKVIAPGMFRIDRRKTSREDKFMPINKVRASIRTNPITVSQPHVITKKDVNSDANGLSFTGVDNTAKTRKPQPRNNPKNDKQCLITVNHDVCVLNYVDDMHSSALNKNENVENVENQKKHKPKVRKPKKVGSKERLASPKPSTPRSCLRWSPTGRMFDLKGKILATSESVCQSDCSKGDNACTSNPQEPISKRFPNSTFSMTGCQNWLDTLLIPLLSEYKLKDKENHGDNECDIG
ncbi:hypothetical protein Tco_0601809 [Tanacetum coccineum]